MDALVNTNGSQSDDISTLTDEQLANWLKNKLYLDVCVAYLHSSHQCKFFEPEATSPSIFPADPGKNSR